MNLNSWTTRQYLTEDTHQYLSEDVIEESIAKTLKPVMNKMKKLNIGLPYRDARIFFYNFLKEKHPELVPDMGKKKPSAKEVNALVGQIAIDHPEKFEKFGEEFDTYATEKVPGSDEDRVSQFLRVAMILRTGKGVRPKKDEGFKKKEYSGLTAQEIKQTTMDAVKKAPVDRGEDADVKDEKLLLKASLAKVLNQMAETDDIDPKIIANITNVGSKIDTVAKFKKFLDYMHQYEEYHIAEEYLRGMLEVIEKSLASMGSEGEEELDDFMTHEHPEENMPPEYEFDDDDIQSIMSGKFPKSKVRKVTTIEFEDEDAEIDHKKADLDKDGKLSEYERKRGQAIADAIEDQDEDDNDQYAPEEAPADDQMGEMEPLDDEEEEDDRISSYLKLQKAKEDMPKIKDEDKDEEDEQIALSPQEVARRMQEQRRQELQNFYRQERLNRYGY